MKYESITIEDLERIAKKLESQRPKHNLIKSDILKGCQVVVKSGNNFYYNPDMTAGEIKLIEVPTPEQILSDGSHFFFDDKKFGWETDLATTAK